MRQWATGLIIALALTGCGGEAWQTKAIDGLLFWALVFARDPQGATPHLALGARLLLLVAIVPPQMLLGAIVTLSDRALFDVYDVCGRALPITALEDQKLGGLLTWVPPVMMSLAGVLILLGRHFKAAGAGAALPASASGLSN